MEVLLQKKREWEFQNHLVLKRLIQSTAELSVESVKAAGLLTSFLLYLIYIVIRGMLVIATMLFCGPRLVRKVSPHHRPQEPHEFNPEYSELQCRSRSIR